jgi:O-antigen/teichoic acid export membrane protein
MKLYFFSLFVRFFIGFSGFVVFLITSKLFGSEGRGIIGFGTSLVSIFGFVLSINLGRSFLFETRGNETLKYKILPDFMIINYLLIIIATLFSFMYWAVNKTAQSFLDIESIFAFLMLIPYYLWIVNGSTIYSVLSKTSKQDVIILSVRVILIIALIFIYLFHTKNIKVFLFIYAMILGSGALFEMAFLGKPNFNLLDTKNFTRYILNSKFVHVDYLAFNLFPLILMLMAGGVFDLKQLGKLNFVIQLISFVFILAVVASIRIKTYVSSKGTVKYLEAIKKLFLFTLTLSIIFLTLIYTLLKTDFFIMHFSSFGDVSIYFLMVSFAVPGYIAYQFIYPILIEYDQIHLSMKINLLILIILVSITYPVLKLYGLIGGVSLFSLFYLLVLLAQFYLYRKLRPMLISN